MLPLKWQPERSPAQIGRYVQNEALHVGQFNIAYIPSFIPPNCLKPSGLQGCHDDIYIIVPVSQHALLVWCHHSAGREPLIDLLQGVPTEGCPILEDVIKRVQGTQLPPLLLMINGRRCQRSLGSSWRGEWGRGRWEILLLLSFPGIPAPPLLCSHHCLPSSSATFLFADLPGHAAQLLQAASPLPLPLTGWIRSTSHPWMFTTTAAVVATTTGTSFSSTTTSVRTLHQHHDNHWRGNLSATWKRGSLCLEGGCKVNETCGSLTQQILLSSSKGQMWRKVSYKGWSITGKDTLDAPKWQTTPATAWQCHTAITLFVFSTSSILSMCWQLFPSKAYSLADLSIPRLLTTKLHFHWSRRVWHCRWCHSWAAVNRS